MLPCPSIHTLSVIAGRLEVSSTVPSSTNWIWSGSPLWPSVQSSFVLSMFAFAETIASRNEHAPSPVVPPS